MMFNNRQQWFTVKEIHRILRLEVDVVMTRRVINELVSDGLLSKKHLMSVKKNVFGKVGFIEWHEESAKRFDVAPIWKTIHRAFYKANLIHLLD